MATGTPSKPNRPKNFGTRYQNPRHFQTVFLEDRHTCQLAETLLAESRSSDNRWLAIIVINLNALVFCGFTWAWKVTASKGVTVGDCAVMRSAIAFLLIQPFRMYSQKSPCKDVPEGRLRIILLRCFLGSANFVGIVGAATMCPLSLLTIILRLSSFWCAVLAYFINSELVRNFEIVAMVFCFVGVVGVTWGGDKDIQGSDEVGNSQASGILLAFGSSFLLGLLAIVNRRLQGVHFSIVTFYHTGIGSVCWFTAVGGYAFIVGKSFLAYDGWSWMWIILTSVLDFACVITNIVAFQSDSSGFVNLLSYTQVVYAFLVDIFFFKQTFGALQLACALAIWATTIAVAAFKLKSG